MFTKASLGFGLPDCGLAAQVAIQVFVEAPSSSIATRRSEMTMQFRSAFMRLTLDADSYRIGEKSVGRMYTSSTRKILSALSIRGFAASTYGRNAGSA